MGYDPILIPSQGTMLQLQQYRHKVVHRVGVEPTRIIRVRTDCPSTVASDAKPSQLRIIKRRQGYDKIGGNKRN